MNLSSLSIKQIFELFERKELTSKELMEFYLANIKEKNSKYNVFLFIRDREELINEAEKADVERRNGSKKKLLGIPFSLKDSYMALGTPTTCGDNYLKDTFSTYNATITQKLLEEGAILIGKVNMDAWGFGGSTQNSSYGVTKNAYDETRVAGGSSGGSAVSVALDMCAFSIAEDTGGSVRNPASYNNLFGLKPTYGRISRFGCVAYASSLDTVAPIAHDPFDLDLIFSILEGSDGHDMTIEEYNTKDTKLHKKFAYSLDFVPDGVRPELKETYLKTIKDFQSKGYEAIEVKIENFKYAISTYYITAMSEASTNLARYHGTRYGDFWQHFAQGKITDLSGWEDLFTQSRSRGLNKEAQRRATMGSFVLSEGFYDAYYKKAQKIRNLISDELNTILKDTDFILSPVTPTSAPLIGENTSNPVESYLEDIYTVISNLSGTPSVSFPVARDPGQLPLGMQIMGRKGDDRKLLEILSK